jgi:hypothetical protein
VISLAEGFASATLTVTTTSPVLEVDFPAASREADTLK